MTAPPDHRPRKRFGQHFLEDVDAIERIVKAIAPTDAQTLVEIGPGLGALTRVLLDHVDELEVVELDRDLAAKLPARLGHPSGLRVHVADALTFDFSALGTKERSVRVVGNLPYNISTPLLFHLIDLGHGICDMHFMLQAEVVDRLVAGPGSRRYGRLSVMAQLACRVEKLFSLGPHAFRPPPKVNSAVVRLEVRNEAPVALSDAASFDAIVRQAFSQRRKTLRNSLKGMLDEGRIQAAGVDPAARPETLDLVAFASLSNQLSRSTAED